MREGTTIRNRYEILKLIGRGGMADVYLAYDRRRMTQVAIKVLREDLAEDPDFLRRFAREAQALAQLDHPNIVRFYSFERQGEIAFIVLDYVSGTTLRRRLLKHEGPLSLEETTRILQQVGGALNYAHSEGFIHRDIKPGNVMLRDDGVALLADFGISRAMESATLTTVTAGTPAYMSPEQITGKSLDVRTDIYSLGVMLYQMVTGRRPFTGEESGLTETSTVGRLREAHLRLAPPDPSRFNPQASSEVSRVILRALAKRPDDRWPDVESMVNAWNSAVGDIAQRAGAWKSKTQPKSSPPPPSSRKSASPPPVPEQKSGNRCHERLHADEE